MSWGSAAKTRLTTASWYESATPYFNLLGIFNLSTLVFKINSSKEILPPSYTNLIKHATDIHHYNTRYAAAQNLYRPVSRTNHGLS